MSLATEIETMPGDNWMKDQKVYWVVGGGGGFGIGKTDSGHCYCRRNHQTAD
jgi:hypothetical protein